MDGIASARTHVSVCLSISSAEDAAHFFSNFLLLTAYQIVDFLQFQNKAIDIDMWTQFEKIRVNGAEWKCVLEEDKICKYVYISSVLYRGHAIFNDLFISIKISIDFCQHLNCIVQDQFLWDKDQKPVIWHLHFPIMISFPWSTLKSKSSKYYLLTNKSHASK